jgi:hypothetical protein
VGGAEARVLDHDGICNPCQPDDRLLLGMKGSIAAFERGDAPGADAGCRMPPGRRRAGGEPAASGACQDRSAISGTAQAGLKPDPGLRVQEVIRLVGPRLREPGSARAAIVDATVVDAAVADAAVADAAVADDDRSDPRPTAFG